MNWAIVSVGAIALATRLLPLLTTGSLGGYRGYDDGVHYSAGVHLIVGAMPYRDFVFVHPPGIALLMAPFAWLAQMTSDVTAISAARLLFVLIGTLNAVLVAVLLRQFGFLGALVGGGLYAVATAATIAERSIMLSPVLNTFVLSALLVLKLHQRHGVSRVCALAGSLMGIALVFKLWAIIPIAVIGGMLSARYGWRAFVRYSAWGAAVATLIVAPFLIMSPSQMAVDIVVAQIQRGSESSVGAAARLQYFLGFALDDPLLWAAGASVALTISIPLAKSLILGHSPRGWNDAPWWALLALTTSGTLMLSKTFIDHYVNFAMPGLSLAIGWAAGSLSSIAFRTFGRKGAAAASVTCALLLLPIAWRGTDLQPAPLPGVDRRELATAASAYTCVWAPYSYMAILSDSLSRSALSGCAPVVDRSGVWMMLKQDLPVTGPKVVDFEASLKSDLQTMMASDAAIVGLPYDWFGITDSMQTALTDNFQKTLQTGNLEVWVRLP